MDREACLKSKGYILRIVLFIMWHQWGESRSQNVAGTTAVATNIACLQVTFSPSSSKRHPRFVVRQCAGGSSASISGMDFQKSCRGRPRKGKECAVGGRHNRTQTARPPGEGGATVAVATLTSKRDVKKNGISLT